MTLAARPKPPVHHKKRTGEHQRHHKHFAKTYWPYLPMLSIVVLSLVFSSLWSHKAAVLGAQSDLSQVSLLNATNGARINDSEPTLTLNPQLSTAAQDKAQDMATKNYWSHNAPDGTTPWDFITASGYTYQKAGENLAYGFNSSDSTITAWLNSPEHRANLLSADYNQVGFGVASSPNYQGKGPETIVVAMYGEAVSNNLGVTAEVKPHAVQGAAAPVKTVSRIQLVSAQAAWTSAVLVTIAIAGLLLILFRHGRAWHRVLVKSEAFVLHHPLFDIAAIFIASAGFVLSQAAGFIG